MSILVMVSDFDNRREICVTACYYSIPPADMRRILDAYLAGIKLPPTKAELYVSEESESSWLAFFAKRGIRLQITFSESSDADLAAMYEATTSMPLVQLRPGLKRHGSLTYTFEKDHLLHA